MTITLPRLACAIASVACLASGVAHADPEEKSQDVAMLLSAGTSAGALAILVYGISQESHIVGAIGAAGVLVGPTTGHIYAGDWWSTKLIVRMSATAAVAAGIGLVAVSNCGPLTGCSGGFGNEVMGASGALLAGAGALVFTGAWFYEIGTAPGAALDANERRRTRTTFVPLLGHKYGVALAGSF